MADPIGENTYKGLGVPLRGESEIIQVNSSNTVLTITHSTANAGLFLAGRNSVSSQVFGPGSSVRTGEQFRIAASGDYQLTSNSSVVVAVSTAGYVAGSESTLQVHGLDSSGRHSGFKRTLLSLTTVGSTIYTLASSDSGKLVVYGQTSGGATITLPTTVAAAGLEYTIIQDAGTATIMQITSTGSNMDIVLAGGAQNTSGPSTADALAPGTTAAQGCWIYGISTARWFLQPFVSLRVGVTSAVMEGAGTWIAGTTIA